MAFEFLAKHNITSAELAHASARGNKPEDYARVVNLPLAYAGQTLLIKSGGRTVGIVYSGDSKVDIEKAKAALGVDSVEIVSEEDAEAFAGVRSRAISPLVLWGKCDLVWDKRTARLPVLCLPTPDDQLSVRLDTRQLRKASIAKADLATRLSDPDPDSAYDALLERGFIERVSDEAMARKLLSKPDVAAYVGFDPTADSLHVGSLMPIMALANAQRTGTRLIAVVGGATGLIGDPSGKTELRKMLTRDDIKSNMNGISEQLSSYLDLSSDRGKLVDNADWFAPIGALEFLRELGPHFSINQMVKSESVKSRMEREGEGLTYLELTYMLLQAYDFVRLAEDENCLVQMGGSDQWGNICAGVDLGRRSNGSELFSRPVKRSAELAGVTFPLLTKADGGKFGKSEAGNVWLGDAVTSVYDFFQFWRNTDDADVERFLALFTFLPLDEVASLCASAEAKDMNLAKELLAFIVTSLRHGAGNAAAAASNARGHFGGYDEAFKSTVLRLGAATEEDLAKLAGSGGKAAGAKAVAIPSAELTGGKQVIEALVLLKLASSKSEARRLVKQGGVYVEGDRIDSIDATLPAAESGTSITLRVGKKKHGIVEVS